MTRPLGSTELKRLHRSWRQRTDQRIALLFDSVQTPYNVGSIIRSAAAWKIDHLWLTGASAEPGHKSAAKTALGTERYVSWAAVEPPTAACDVVKGAGYRLVAVELSEGARPAMESDLSGDICLVVGHEDRGISKDVLAACDEAVYLPLLGKVGSLNVATACSVAIYEARRQGWAAQQSGQ